MTTPEITPEIRQAVLDAECDARGHQLNVQNVWAGAEIGNKIQGPEGKFPHIICHRCGRVWIVLPSSGRNYAQAERRFRDRLKAGDPDATV